MVGVVAGLLVAAMAVSVQAALWAGRQLARAERAEQAARDQQGLAEQARESARRHQERAEQSARRALDQRARAQERETIAVAAVRRYVDVVRDTPEWKHDPALAALRKALLEEPQDFFGKLRDRLQADRDTTPESPAWPRPASTWARWPPRAARTRRPCGPTSTVTVCPSRCGLWLGVVGS